MIDADISAAAHSAAIVGSSVDATLSTALGGVVLSWNASAERMFGYDAAEIIGQPITRLFPPDLVKEEKCILECLRGSIGRYETVRVNRSTEPGI